MKIIHVIIGLMTIFGGIFSIWFRWRLKQAKKDRIARQLAEQQAVKFQEALKNNIERNEQTQNKIAEINSGVNDDRANAIMRERPKTPGKLPRSVTSKNRRNKH